VVGVLILICGQFPARPDSASVVKSQKRGACAPFCHRRAFPRRPRWSSAAVRAPARAVPGPHRSSPLERIRPAPAWRGCQLIGLCHRRAASAVRQPRSRIGLRITARRVRRTRIHWLVFILAFPPNRARVRNFARSGYRSWPGSVEQRPSRGASLQPIAMMGLKLPCTGKACVNRSKPRPERLASRVCTH